MKKCCIVLSLIIFTLFLPGCDKRIDLSDADLEAALLEAYGNDDLILVPAEEDEIKNGVFIVSSSEIPYTEFWIDDFSEIFHEYSTKLYLVKDTSIYLFLAHPSNISTENRGIQEDQFYFDNTGSIIDMGSKAEIPDDIDSINYLIFVPNQWRFSGGFFNEKEDIQKLYEDHVKLFSDVFSSITPYIDLPPQNG